jgi:pimeloyl-ACP methyl ester carboxylesterase
MTIQNPVIVIPGITATELLDDYPLKTEDIWTMVFNKEYERIALHPDDIRYEAIEPAHVFPGRAFSIYNDLIKALRHELTVQADKPTPVFAFPYDWRNDIRHTGKLLGEFVQEVIARTKLLKHYAKARNLRVDLVGHSMGGLIICEYLSAARSKAQVERVVTIGAPFKGSVEAIVKIATGKDGDGRHIFIFGFPVIDFRKAFINIAQSSKLIAESKIDYSFNALTQT